MSDKEKIILLANELINQGQELIDLVLNDRFIDYSFRAEKLNLILQALKSKEICKQHEQGDKNV